jgi:hypothetical protein
VPPPERPGVALHQVAKRPRGVVINFTLCENDMFMGIGSSSQMPGSMTLTGWPNMFSMI